MLIRTMILALAVGSFAAGCVADDSTAEETGTETAALGSSFSCGNVPDGCECVGGLIVLPININIEDIDVLNDSQLNILEGGLNVVDIGNGTNVENVLNNLNLKVLNIFNNDLDIPVTDNEVDVCTTLLGALFCK